MKKKLYEANRWWNDWKFQLHWHKLEWVNTRSKIKRKNPIKFLQKTITLLKVMEHHIGLVIQK